MTATVGLRRVDNSAADDWAVWQRFFDGDRQARDELVESNMQLVYWLARRFGGRGVEWDDLCQVGAMGLMKAVDNFRPEYNNRFSTYAVPMIMGELRHLVRGSSLLHISRAYREKQAEIAKNAALLQNKLQREPTLQELADFCEMSVEDLAEVQACADRPLSLQQRTEGEGELSELVAAKESEDMWAERLALQAAVENLPKRLAYILSERYVKENSQSVIAQKLGISQVQVSRLEKQAIEKLRCYYN